jgi:hypothetical protein
LSNGLYFVEAMSDAGVRRYRVVKGD